MANSRRIAALDLLHRLKQLELEQTGEKLVEIRREQGVIDAEKSDLQRRAIEETQVTSPEALPFVADFLASLEARKTQLNDRMVELDRAAAGFEDALTNAFIDAKTQETVLGQARRALKLEQAQREEAESAEVGQRVFQRRAIATRRDKL